MAAKAPTVRTATAAEAHLLSPACMQVYQTTKTSFGVGVLTSGNYSVKLDVDTTFEPQTITQVLPGVRITIPTTTKLSFSLPVTADMNLIIVERDQSIRAGDRQYIDNLAINIYNVGREPINMKRGDPIASFITSQHVPLTILDDQTSRVFADVIDIPSTVFGFIAEIYKANSDAVISKYFADSDPLRNIEENPDYKNTPHYIAQELFKKMNSEVRKQVTADYEQYKRQKLLPVASKK